MNLPELLVRLLIGVLVFFIGDRLLGLITNPQAKQILEVILIVAVVLFVAFGNVIPLR